MKKIVFVLAALLLVGCSESSETPRKEIKTNEADIDSAPTNSPHQDTKPAYKKPLVSEGDDYMRTHTPKPNKSGWGTEGAVK